MKRPDSTALYRDDYQGPFQEKAARIMVLQDPLQLERVRSLYDGEIRHADALFGRLLAELRRLSIWDDAIVVFTSDHGEEFMEHGHLQHGWLTEENVRIPLIVRHPALSGQTRLTVRVSNLDLVPSLTALVGIEAPDGIDGRSWLGGKPEPESNLAVANTDPRILAASIVVDGSKLIVHCGQRNDRELYDLAHDPQERHDLAGEQPDLAARLEARLFEELDISHCKEIALTRQGSRSTRVRGLTRTQIQALKRLGYLDAEREEKDPMQTPGAGDPPSAASGSR